MKVVLLAGGSGTRLSEETDYKPKPMIEIGGMPIIWHIMKYYSYFGYNDFIICAGYKQEYVKQWFSDYYLNTNDVTFDYSGGGTVEIHRSASEPWRVTVCDTGKDTLTGGRIKRIEPYVHGETFMVTYGDGVCDVNINELVKYHEEHGKIATLTSVKRKETKGVLEIDNGGTVREFREKREADGKPINVGYMVFNSQIFDYIDDDGSSLERDVLSAVADKRELMSYNHEGFWQCMDTLLEQRQLERLINENKAPWILW